MFDGRQCVNCCHLNDVFSVYQTTRPFRRKLTTSLTTTPGGLKTALSRVGDQTPLDAEMVSSPREQYFDSDLENRGDLENTAEQTGTFE